MAARSKAPDDKRSYSRVSNDIWRNKKILATGLRVAVAVGAHSSVIAWCADEETDGVFMLRALLRLAEIDQAEADAMIRVGLWHTADHECQRCPQPGPGEAVVHDFLRHQRSAEEIHALSAKRSAAGSRGADVRYGDTTRPDPTRPPNSRNAETVASAMASAMANAQQNGSNVLAELELEKELNPPLPPREINSRPDAAHPGEGEDPEQDTDADRLAVLVAEILTVRDDWSERTVARTAAAALTDRRGNFPLIAEAFRIVAADVDGTDTPGRLLAEGPWWAQAARQLRVSAIRDTPRRPVAPVFIDGPALDVGDPGADDYRHPFAECSTRIRGRVVCGHPGCGEDEHHARHRPDLRLVPAESPTIAAGVA